MFVDCNGSLSTHIARDNTNLRELHFVYLTRWTKAYYTGELVSLAPNQYYLHSTNTQGLVYLTDIGEHLLSDIKDIQRIVSDFDIRWYLVPTPLTDPLIPIPPDVNSFGDNCE